MCYSSSTSVYIPSLIHASKPNVFPIDYVIDHGQLTPASISTLDGESIIFSDVLLIDAADVAVLLYVLGIGLGLLASRLWVLMKDTHSVSDEEAQVHLARRSQ